jgi:hypothetical protein
MSLNSVFQSPVKTILLSGAVAGTLDISSAIIFLAHGKAAATLKFVARGAFGDAAYSSGDIMIFFGLIIHYFIAYSFATVFFFIYPFIPFLQKQKVIGGLLYGVFVWAFMQYVVLRFTYAQPAPFSFSPGWWKGIVILMLAIGLPVSLITNRYYATIKK